VRGRRGRYGAACWRVETPKATVGASRSCGERCATCLERTEAAEGTVSGGRRSCRANEIHIARCSSRRRGLSEASRWCGGLSEPTGAGAWLCESDAIWLRWCPERRRSYLGCEPICCSWTTRSAEAIGLAGRSEWTCLLRLTLTSLCKARRLTRYSSEWVWSLLRLLLCGTERRYSNWL